MDSAVSSVLAAQNSHLSNQVGIAVLRKAMDVEKAAGDQIVNMIRQAAAPTGDAEHRGPGLDLYA